MTYRHYRNRISIRQKKDNKILRALLEFLSLIIKLHIEQLQWPWCIRIDRISILLLNSLSQHYSFASNGALV
jgi:hypothetical protein